MCEEESAMMKSFYLLLLVFHFTEGCNLSDTSHLEVTGYSGGSALLPCSCSDPQTKPQTFSWSVYRDNGNAVNISHDERYRNRVKLFNNDNPANLSLLITNLTLTDERDYSCLTDNELRYFKLKVKDYDLMKTEDEEVLTGFTGESVVLSCSCTDQIIKTTSLTWMFRSIRSTNHNFYEIYPKHIRKQENRVRLANENQPGNFSLIISDLNKEDEGIYKCTVQKYEKRFRLVIKERTPIQSQTSKPSAELPRSEPEPVHPGTTTTQAKHTGPSAELPTILSISMVLLLLILCIVGFICWRYRGRRNGQKGTTEVHPSPEETQKDPNSSDVTYSTITHVNTARPARLEISTEGRSEYATIKA